MTASVDGETLEFTKTKCLLDPSGDRSYLLESGKYYIHCTWGSKLFVQDKTTGKCLYEQQLKWITSGWFKWNTEDYTHKIRSIIEIEDNSIMLVGSGGFMGVFNLDKMEQTLILPPQFDGNYARSITKIINSTFAVGTTGGVYMIDISKKDSKPTIMLKGKQVSSVKLINNGNILCGTSDGYYLLDIGRKEEKKLATGERQTVLNMCLLSSIDAKYNNLALTLESSTVNILNMDTASIIKIADVVTSKYGIFTDSHMQITKSSNEENFSFVFISGKDRKEISAFTVRRELADLCLSR